MKCEINTIKDEIIVKKGFPINQAYLKGTREKLGEFIKKGTIRYSNSKWRTPIKVVRKPDGKLRICQNFIALNAITEREHIDIPNIREIVNSTIGKKFFTVIDLRRIL